MGEDRGNRMDLRRLNSVFKKCLIMKNQSAGDFHSAHFHFVKRLKLST